MTLHNHALVIHGGAFSLDRDYTAQALFIRDVLKRGHAALANGTSALDAATDAVHALEDSGLYVAGKGAGPNRKGYWELDASIMDGTNGKCGAVSSLRRFQNPIRCARAVMEKSEQVFFTAEGAENFLLSHGFKTLPDPSAYFTPVEKPAMERAVGTVGAVALDKQGRLAAATSTGGVKGKPEGRVGDTPLIGAATWADNNIAISTTGIGEYFIRSAAAHDVAARVRYAAQSSAGAVEAALARVKELGGWGGIISVSRDGTVYCGHAATGMHHGWVGGDGVVHVSNH